MTDAAPSGFLNICKPLQLTSHDVVAAVRRRYRAQTGARKVGHAGTLDPLAEGVLVICLGAATRLSEYVMNSRKVYRAKITFGRSTTTYDAAGEAVSRADTDTIGRAQIEALLPQFKGEILQVPPMYSALKIGGKKLYELARQGETVARPPREVIIHRVDIIAWRNPVLELEIVCGAGTYIRSLAHDLGEAAGVGAYLSGLTRKASGVFNLGHSISLETILETDDWLRHLISPYDALRDRPRLVVDEDDIRMLRQGRFITREHDLCESTVFAFDAAKRLVAVLEQRDTRWKPHKVFHGQA